MTASMNPNDQGQTEPTFKEVLDFFQIEVERLKAAKPPMPTERPATQADIEWMAELEIVMHLIQQMSDGLSTPDSTLKTLKTFKTMKALKILKSRQLLISPDKPRQNRNPKT